MFSLAVSALQHFTSSPVDLLMTPAVFLSFICVCVCVCVRGKLENRQKEEEKTAFIHSARL